MTAPGSSFVGILRFQTKDSIVTLQPKTPPASDVNSKDKRTSLQIDLRTGQVSVLKLPALPEDAVCVGGVIGFLKMQHGSVLALVTKAKRVSGSGGVQASEPQKLMKVCRIADLDSLAST